MYISLVNSRAKGFKKWSDAHQPHIGNDDHAGAGMATELDLDNGAMAPGEPHRPWQMAGVGMTL